MRLNTDNPLTMPITDSVYGKTRKPKDKPAQELRLGHSSIACLIPQRQAERLARRGTGSTRRLVGGRRKR